MDREGFFIETGRLYLRAVTQADVTQRYCDWLNDPQVNRFLETRFMPATLEEVAAYVRRMAGSPDVRFLAMVLKEGDLHIGNIKLGPIDWIHRHADVSLFIGEKGFWGKGLATEAIGALASYAFDVLNLHKLTAGAYAENLASLRAFKKVGFQEEGYRRQQRFSEGKYVDEVLLGLIRGTGRKGQRRGKVAGLNAEGGNHWKI